MNSHRVWVFVLVFLGGGLGSMVRHFVNEKGLSLWGVDFPYGTMVINIAGSLVMGLVAGWFALRGQGGQLPRLFVATGILGGFTTFSTFSLDASLLLERGQTWTGLLYVVGSVGLGIVGLFTGLAIMRSLLS
jgi:CrcB protein